VSAIKDFGKRLPKTSNLGVARSSRAGRTNFSFFDCLGISAN
jgi:hypothetical protein